MLKQKPVHICDFCGKEIGEKPYIYNVDGGDNYSMIMVGKNSYDVQDQDYCSIDCLFSDIKKHLGILEV